MKATVYFLLILFSLSLFSLNNYAQTDPDKETPRIENSCLIATVDDIKSVKVYNYYIGDVTIKLQNILLLCEIEFTNFTPLNLWGPYWGYDLARFSLFLNDKLLLDPPIRLFGPYSSIFVPDLSLNVNGYEISDVFKLKSSFYYSDNSRYTDEEIEQQRKQAENTRTLRIEQYEVFLQYMREAGKLIDLTNIEPVTHHEPSDISIYPNPTTGELRIRNYELGITNYETTLGVSQLGIEGVEIYDIVGKKQSTVNCQLSTDSSIDISHLPAGIYFVRITTEKGVFSKKVVKR